jgi:hypothetical protein
MRIWYKFTSYYNEIVAGIVYDSDDEYSRNDTETSWDAPAVAYLTKPTAGHYECDEIGDVLPEEKIYVTWVQYSTGDSFGHDSGYGQEIIGWYKNLQDAEAAERAIKTAGNSMTVTVPTYDGTGHREQHCSAWNGYFESLDFVSDASVTVRLNK